MNADVINDHRLCAKEFAEQGGNEALYWAGQMSICVSYLQSCASLDLSYGLADLFRIKNEYDAAIFRIAHEQNNKNGE